MHIKEFVFNPFEENTYILYDDSGDCIIIDPGCYDVDENEILRNFIILNKLMPVQLLNTHCHIDHVFGNHFISGTYSLSPRIHPLETPVLEAAPQVCEMYGLKMQLSPAGITDLSENTEITFGNTALKILFTPGHSPGSVCFYNEATGQLIGGDVLFQMSIGRTDLPGGDFQTLLNSIRQKLFLLPDEVIVYPGHGPQTTIGYEKKFNPFLTDAASFTS